MSGFLANPSTFLVPEDLPPSAWTGHVPFAFWIVEAMAPATLVELGTHYGTSFLGFCQAISARGGGTRAFAVDTWEGDEHAGHYGDEVYNQLAPVVQKKYARFAQLLRMRFDQALPTFRDGEVDLLHIDGLHTYEAVKDDFESWLPKLSRRGVVLFHDTQVRERGFGVWKLWDELRARYPSFEFSHTHGLGVLLVGDEQPEALRALCGLDEGGRALVDHAFEALGQRVVQLARADHYQAKYEDAEKFRVHYKAVFERAEAALAQRDAELAAARAAADALGKERDAAQARTLAAEAGRQALVDALAAREGELAEARADLRRRDELLREARVRAELRQGEVDRVLASHSWRITAPLRWLRGCLGALRHRRPMPAYSHMLGLPVFRSPAAPALPAVQSQSADARGAEATLPAPERAYLDGLFAGDAAARAPEYLPASTAPAPDPSALRAKAIAFYLPQFHTFEENEAWWGKGFTEWTNVTKAVPQFLGHHQPQLPADLGFYDLRVPEVLKRQAEMARQYGLHGFAFHYYWFAGKRLMEKPLDLYLAQEDIDFPFCLCWANENWTRRWDGRDCDVLISQVHGPENDQAFIEDLEPYLRDRRYIRIDGRPLLIVYRPSILPDPAATLRRWREHCRKVGIGELFIAMVQFDTEDPREHGFDAAMEFPPHKLARGFEPINASLDIINPDYKGHVMHYQCIVDSAKAWPDKGFPLVRTVFPGWDNEARRPGKGYTFAYSTPERYREWLEFAVDYAERHPVAGERIVMVNAWNEWAEGAKLEPDRRFGHAFLQATRDTLLKPRGVVGPGPGDESPARKRIVVVSHDAHPHGAQYLALNLCRELGRMGFAVDAVLLGDGSLLPEFEAAATVHRLSDPAGEEGRALARQLARDGLRHVIANTAVSGAWLPALAEAGLVVVSLVHELPGVLAEYGLQDAAARIARHAHRVVFAAQAVREGFEAVAALPEAKVRLRPQGIYKRNRFTDAVGRELARREVREELGIPANSKLMLGVGYADLRKGVDLFVEAAARLAVADPCFHAAWLGHFDQTLEPALRARVRALGMEDRIHFPGRKADTDPWYAGADLMALTSREDPFPSVVMEALDVGVPVVAFAGTGGAGELLRRGGGCMVPSIDADAFARACAGLLGDDAAREAMGREGQALVASEFSFRKYVFDLLAMLGIDLPRVSVVVPNYNYGHLIERRLRSIAGQTLPYYELIVLDDASTDDSLARIHALRGEVEFRLIASARNSGSVFRQWMRGVEAATGEFAWIAEADDLSDPAFLEVAVRGLSAPDVVMSYTQSQQVGPDDEVLAPDYLDYTADISRQRWTRPFVANMDEELRSGLAVKNTIPNVSAVVFRTRPLAEVLSRHLEEIASYRVAGDWVVYLRMLELGRLAFSPRALNLHRRHAGGVTLGGDNVRHLREVIRVQRWVDRSFVVPEDQRASARAYLQALHRHFGLGQAEGEGVEGDERFADLLGSP